MLYNIRSTRLKSKTKSLSQQIDNQIKEWKLMSIKKSKAYRQR